MTSKRKFQIPADSQEDITSSAGKFGGQAAFKKYKEDLKQNQKTGNKPSSPKFDRTTSELARTVITSSKIAASSTTSNQEQIASSAPAVPIIQTKSNDSTSTTNSAACNNTKTVGKTVGSTSTTNSAACNNTKTVGKTVGSTSTTNSAACNNTKIIGKTFGETFGYLKNTDLYVLPSLPQPAGKSKQENSNSIIVNQRQRGNPILKHIRNLPWEYGEIIPDYEIGKKICALFLSMRYHTLNPDYIHERLKKLGNLYELRLLLVQVDVVNCKPSLKELGRIAMLADCTLILAWSPEEAGRYLETYKQYENKPPDVLQQRIDTDHLSKMQNLLTTIKSINKTDVITLMSTFGSLKKITNASLQEIGDCPGIGSLKASRLHKAFSQPFKRRNSVLGGNTQDAKINDRAVEKQPDGNQSTVSVTEETGNISSVSNLKLPSEVLSSHSNKLSVIKGDEELLTT